MDEQYLRFKKTKNKNDKLILKKYDKFIKQQKDFNDDVWSVVLSFMIDARYKKSFKLKLNREMRYCDSLTDATSFFIGNRFKNLIQVKQTRYDNGSLVQEAELKYYKVKTMLMKRKDGGEIDVLLLEYIDILCEHYDCGGEIHSVFYMVSGDKHRNSLWTNEDQNKLEELEREQLYQQDIDTDDDDY